MDLLLLSEVQELPLDLFVDFSAFTDLYIVISPHLRPVLVPQAHPWATWVLTAAAAAVRLESGSILIGIIVYLLKVQTLKPDYMGLHPSFTSY